MLAFPSLPLPSAVWQPQEWLSSSRAVPACLPAGTLALMFHDQASLMIIIVVVTLMASVLMVTLVGTRVGQVSVMAEAMYTMLKWAITADDR